MWAECQLIAQTTIEWGKSSQMQAAPATQSLSLQWKKRKNSKYVTCSEKTVHLLNYLKIGLQVSARRVALELPICATLFAAKAASQ